MYYTVIKHVTSQACILYNKAEMLFVFGHLPSAILNPRCLDLFLRFS